ncbi:MAG: PQQ-binding-like beta-propeller repeat protein, partial [Phenylobacterium sp.]
MAKALNRTRAAIAAVVFVLTAVVATPLLAAPDARATAGDERIAQAQQTYARSCAACHGADLKGAAIGKPLSGPAFLATWGARPASALSDYIRGQMPPAARGSLSPAESEALAAYVLKANGRSVTAEAAPAAAAAPGRAPDREGQRSNVIQEMMAAVAKPYRQREVANYRPVTEAMLTDPPVGDWLNWRRTRDGQGFSPLDQISSANVDRLRLAWALGSTGTQEPTPLAHDGVLYFTGPDGLLQAMDGATGDVIWEFEYRTPTGEAAPGMGARNVAILGDKLFLQAPDGALAAVNARTGELVWRAERPRGNSSGPTVAKGVVIAGMGGCQFYK